MPLEAIEGVTYQDPETGDLYIDEDALLTVSGDDDMGYEDVGDDELGATKRRRVVRRRGTGKVRHADMTRGTSRKVAGRKQIRVKSGLLGLSNTSVVGAGTGTLDATAQEPCYLQRLLLDGNTESFTLTDVKVGSKSIYSGVESVPAGMFRPDATGAPFSFKHRMRVGQSVSVLLLNIDPLVTKSLSGAFKTIEQV